MRTMARRAWSRVADRAWEGRRRTHAAQPNSGDHLDTQLEASRLKIIAQTAPQWKHARSPRACCGRVTASQALPVSTRRRLDAVRRRPIVLTASSPGRATWSSVTGFRASAAAHPARQRHRCSSRPTTRRPDVHPEPRQQRAARAPDELACGEARFADSGAGLDRTSGGGGPASAGDCARAGDLCWLRREPLLVGDGERLVRPDRLVHRRGA